MMLWLVVMLTLLPVKIFELPHHIEPVDCWILMGLPVVWFYFILERQRISLPYAVPMWLILVASLVSTFAAPKPSNSFIVILKEIYLFVWFVTLVAILSRLSARDFRRIMFVWSGVVILHGALIIGQFFLPEIWQITTRLAGGTVVYDNFRPAGLFVDPEKAGSANKASFFQLFGYVPLLLASYSKKVTIILGIFLFSSMLATGSMGGITALGFGLMSAVIAITFFSKRYLVLITKIFFQLAIAISLLGVAYFFVISQNQGNQGRLESILSGRAERSSEGRFNLWERGIDELLDREMSLWGIGPENFRVVDWQGKQLHNDLLAFSVERGLLGALSLVLFGLTAVSRAIYLLRIYNGFPERPRLEVAVFLAAIAAALFESLTHQVFHAQQLWLVLALQEAMLLRVMTFENRLRSPCPPFPRSIVGAGIDDGDSGGVDWRHERAESGRFGAGPGYHIMGRRTSFKGSS